MKNKLAFLLLAFLTLASSTFAQSNLLTGSVGNYGLAPQTGIACTMTLVSPNPRTVNGIFIRRDPVVATSDANGAFYFTNVVWGNYTLTFAGRVDTIFKLAVLTNTEGTVPLASLATSATVAMPNPATNFYTMSQVDALVAGAGGGGATWTNAHDSVVLIAGDRGVSGDAIESVFAGYVAGAHATNAVSDVFIGTGAGRYAADAVGSTFIGAYAGRHATNNTESVFIGKYAGESVTRPNTFIVSGTVADVGTNALIYGEFDNGLLRVNGNLAVTGTATGPDATTTNGFVTLQQLASSIGSTHTMWASTNTGFLAGYYNALMEPPTHPAATITVAVVTNGQILAQWTSDTNMASVIRAGIGSIASRQRIASTSGNHALTVMPAFYIRHANASETAIDSAQSIPLSDVLTDYNTEFMISSNMNVLATDRMVVRWVATSVGNTPTWQFECGSTVYGIVVNFPVVPAMTGGYLTNGDTRQINFAGGLYGTVLHSPPTDWGTVFRSADETETLIYSELDNSWVFPVNVILQGSVTGSGDQLTNSAGYRISRMADTNWVLAQIASLGAHVYATGTTNTQGVLTLTNKAQGWASVPTTVTTNTVSAAAGQYVRSVVSTNTFARFEAGPISIEAYAFRVGTLATSVSFHPDIYIYDPILSNLVEVAAAPSQVCQSNTPVLFDFSVSIPTSFVPTNASHIVWAWKIDGTNGTPTSLNFVSGGAYDSHLSFSVPAASGFTLPSTVPLTNINNVFYGSNTFNGVTYFSALRSAYPGGNIGIGSNAAQVASAGLENVAIGLSALSKNTNGSYNVAIGSSALQNATNVSSTVAIGYQAQQNLQDGVENTAVGQQSQKVLTTGYDNTAVGSFAQVRVTTGFNNTAVGRAAQAFITTGNANVAVGSMAQGYAVAGTGNIGIGLEAQNTVSGDFNVGIGRYTQNVLTTGSANTAVGDASQYRMIGGANNTSMGQVSLNGEVNGSHNTGVGYYSLVYQTNGTGMTALGSMSGAGASAADNASSMRDANCTFLGTSSGRSSTIANTTPLTNATSIGYNSKAIANNTVTLGGTGKEAVALVLNPMGSQPTNIPPNFAYFYSITNSTNAVVEMYVSGGDGVATQISPHADDAPAQLYDKTTGDMKEIIWRESNPYITNGLVSFINMRRMARTMELQTRVLLLLCGTTNASTTAAAARLKTMTVAEKQVLMTEDYPTYNARTGNNLQPLDWDVIQTGVQATYDMQRANVDLQRTYLGQTNAVIQAQIDAGDTNATLVALPEPLPVKDVRQAKPAWMK